MVFLCKETKILMLKAQARPVHLYMEANPNPNLAADEDFAQSAKAAGVEYPELLENLLALGAAYQAEWRAYYG